MITSKIYNNLIIDVKKDIFKIMNYEFKNSELLLRALTHSSLKNEPNVNVLNDNEKLEFIGDAVLDLIVSNFLLSHIKFSKSEGVLSVNRAKIVNEKSLFLFATELNLNKYLLVSKSGFKMSIQNNPSVLADAFEALVGAIFLDSSYEVTEKIIINKFKGDFVSIIDKSKENYKGLINELLTKNKLEIPTYKITSIIGPDHNRIYTSTININNKSIASGKGNSIRESEQEAAKNALIILKEEKYV